MKKSIKRTEIDFLEICYANLTEGENVREVEFIYNDESTDVFSPYVKSVSFDSENYVFNLCDQIEFEDGQVVDIYFNMDTYGRIVGLLYNDFFWDYSLITEVQDNDYIEAYNKYKNELKNRIEKMKNKKMAEYAEHQGKFLMLQNRSEMDGNQI